MLLFDGAIRFGEQAKAALEQKNFEQTFLLIGRTQKIVNQLIYALKPDVSPDLCKKLASLYMYAYRKLAEASIEHRLESIDEALNVLKYQRQTWSMLMESLAKGKAGAAAQKLDIPSPNARMEASISMQG